MEHRSAEESGSLGLGGFRRAAQIPVAGSQVVVGHRQCGVVVFEREDGAVKRFAFAAAAHHMNGAGTVHGGMLMTFLDTSMSRTSRLISDAKSTATVSLTCDFVAPAKLGDVIESRVRVTRRTRTIVFISAELVCGENTLMVGSGVWKIPPTPE